MSKIWVVSDTAETGYQLISKAMELGEEITAYLNADSDGTANAYKYGAKRAVSIRLPENALWEQYAPKLAEEAEKESPQLILVSASKRGKTLAACLGGLLDLPVMTEIKSIENTSGTVSFKRTVYGGLAEKEMEITDGGPVIVSIAPGTYEKKESDQSVDGNRAVDQLPLPPVSGLTVIERTKKKDKTIHLNESKTVVGVGRGFGKKENMKYAEELAQALNGDIACSRPVTEDFHWLPEEQYVGISGQIIKPDLYIAAGISGQVQHVYGVRDAKTIVAINKDENAPIFDVADYYIVGNLEKVIPEIVQALEKQ